MRILKGYSKAEQKELKKVKEIGINDFSNYLLFLEKVPDEELED